MLIFAIVYDSDECSKAAVALFSVTVMLIMLGAASNTHRYTNYKVTLDDTVPAKEFLSKYELLNIDGEIYEIREYITE